MFTRQLGDILHYAEQVQAVDTTGIPPTSHVLAGAPVERADVVAPCLDRDDGAGVRTRRGAGGGALPRPAGHRLMADLSSVGRLAAATRTGACRRPTRAARRSTPSPQGTPASTPSSIVEAERALGRAADLDRLPSASRGVLHGVPVALKDNLCTRGGLTTAASKILAGVSSAVRRDGRHATRTGGRDRRRQDELRRVRDGIVDRELGVRADEEPGGLRRARPADRAADRRRRSPRGWCPPRSARTPADRSASPPRSAASSG